MKSTSIFEYFEQFPPEERRYLVHFQEIIREVLPDATELISYQMPAFRLEKKTVYYALCKKHLGFYPTPKPIAHFQEELKPYKTSKGAVQFPLNQEFPKELIQEMLRFHFDLISR